MSNRFYVNCDLSVPDLILQGPEVDHLATVCRFDIGDQVCLFNGDGHEYPGTILSATRQRVAIKIMGRESAVRELPYPLLVAAPLPKGERGQFLVEKLTEIGVARYIPLRTKRTVVYPGRGKVEKLHRYVIEASKQCG